MRRHRRRMLAWPFAWPRFPTDQVAVRTMATMSGARDRRSTVLHYVQTWLPLSEQFVHTLVTHTEHPAVVVARAPLENVDSFPVTSVRSLARVLPAMDKPTT